MGQIKVGSEKHMLTVLAQAYKFLLDQACPGGRKRLNRLQRRKLARDLSSYWFVARAQGLAKLSARFHRPDPDLKAFLAALDRSHDRPDSLGNGVSLQLHNENSV